MRLEGEHDAHVSSSTHGSMPVGEVNHSGNAWTQVFIILTLRLGFIGVNEKLFT